MSSLTEKFLFTPPVLGNCYSWLDAATSNNFTFSSGSNISTWIDRSGNNFTLTATNSPRYDSVNERVIFTGASSQSMQNTSAPLDLRQRSFFFVIQEITNTNVCGIMPIIPNPTSGIDYIATTGLTIEGTSGVYFYGNSGAYANRATATVPLAKGIYSEVYSSLNGTTFVNGTVANTFTASYTPGTSAGYGLGGRWSNGMSTPYFNGYMYEMVVFRKALNQSEREQMEGYLAWKWNLVGSLPASHPYKLTPVYASPPFPLVPRVLNITNQAVFDPRSLSGCQLWFDAADLSTVTLINGLVSQWNDKSANGYRVLQTTSAFRPSLTSSRLNGLFGIQLSQSTFLSNASSNMTNFTTGAATSMFMVAKNASTNANWNIINTVWFTGASAGTQRYHFSFNIATTPGVALYLNTTPQIGQVATIAPNANAIIGFTASLSSTSINVNGTSTAFSGNTLTDANDATTFLFGDARNNAASSDTAVYEMVGYNRQLTTSEIQRLEGYFSWKWGLSSVLPSSHPFSANPIAPFVYQIRLGNERSFTPLSLTGCTVWLDGADPNANGILPENGAAVSSWVDKSNNGMTVSAASSLPIYSRRIQNKLGALTFDGTMNLTTGNVPASKFAGNTVNLTLFCIFSFSTAVSGSTYASPFCWANGGGVPRIALSAGNNADGVMMDVGSNVIGRTSFSVPPPTFDNTFYLISYFKNGVNTQINLNGTTKATTNNQDTTQFGSSIYAFNVGNGYSNSQYFMRGNVGEIIFYGRTLSTTEFQQIEGSLAWKWGLQANLPSTHPFKLFPPPP